MSAGDAGYYRRDLALVHDRGFAFHAGACAPGILRLLEPVRARGGAVVELGCGSGALTRHLVAAGHREWGGTWRRDDERHDNVLIETSRVPALLAGEGVEARVAASFGEERLPVGLRAVVGTRAS